MFDACTYPRFTSVHARSLLDAGMIEDTIATSKALMSFPAEMAQEEQMEYQEDVDEGVYNNPSYPDILM